MTTDINKYKQDKTTQLSDLTFDAFIELNTKDKDREEDANQSNDQQ